MVYARPFLRLVMSGTLFGGLEQWSSGFTLIQRAGPMAQVVPQEVPVGVRTAVSGLFAPLVMLSGQARLTTIKLNLIGVDGKYVDTEGSVIYDFPNPIAGGFAAAIPAPQLALAATLRTGARRGLASSGRMYLPMPGFPLDNSAKISAQACTTAANAVSTMLNAATDALPGWVAGVVSNVGEGQERVVTRVEVGNVLDTMRSRRAKITEAYTSATVVLAA